jgi:hypothetical protein
VGVYQDSRWPLFFVVFARTSSLGFSGVRRCWTGHPHLERSLLLCTGVLELVPPPGGGERFCSATQQYVVRCLLCVGSFLEMMQFGEFMSGKIASKQGSQEKEAGV